MAELDEYAYLAALADLEEAEILNQQPHRIFHHRDNAFETLSDTNFVRTYRLTKNMTWDLIDLIEPYLEQPSRRSALDVTVKVLTTLNFLAYGSYQFSIGQNINSAVSQSSVSRAVSEITDIMNRPEIFNRFVHFPQNFEELRRKRDEFLMRHNFHGAFGCIDCTHVAIFPPKIDDPIYPEHLYINRKGYHSINVQLICDANTKIMNVLARYPGSSHDCFIWNNSNVLPLMERLHINGHRSYFLLGDSGYPLRTYLQTPVTNPETAAERNFNDRLTSARSTIERCNGILKLRFRCLLKHRTLHYAPERASKIINTCVILHNLCIENNLPNVPPEDGDELDMDFGIIEQGHFQEPPGGRVNPALLQGRQMRQALIRNYFN